MSYILKLLKEKPDSTFSQEELATIFNKSKSTISRNIKRLKKKNSIIIQKKGKFNHIQLNPNYTTETDTTTTEDTTIETITSQTKLPKSFDFDFQYPFKQIKPFFPALDQVFEDIKNSTNPSAKTWQKQIEKHSKQATVVFFYTMIKESFDKNLIKN